eukprot:scaffold235557_cov25-Tisochrysis_lutea.AAC.1
MRSLGLSLPHYFPLSRTPRGASCSTSFPLARPPLPEITLDRALPPHIRLAQVFRAHLPRHLGH